MYLIRRAWAELTNEVLVLPSRTLALLWVLGVLALPILYGDAYVLRIVGNRFGPVLEVASPVLPE